MTNPETPEPDYDENTDQLAERQASVSDSLLDKIMQEAAAYFPGGGVMDIEQPKTTPQD